MFVLNPMFETSSTAAHLSRFSLDGAPYQSQKPTWNMCPRTRIVVSIGMSNFPVVLTCQFKTWNIWKTETKIFVFLLWLESVLFPTVHLLSSAAPLAIYVLRGWYPLQWKVLSGWYPLQWKVSRGWYPLQWKVSRWWYPLQWKVSRRILLLFSCLTWLLSLLFWGKYYSLLATPLTF